MNPSYASSGAAVTRTGALSCAWKVTDLGVGEGGLITLTGVVSPGLAPGVITNTVTLDGPTDSATSSAGLTVLLGSPPALSIDKTVTPSVGVAYRGTVSYTIVVANSGLGDASDVLMTDTLPISTTFARWVSEPGGSSRAGDQITWQGGVAAGQRLTWTFVVSHTGGYGDAVINIARYGQATGSGSTPRPGYRRFAAAFVCALADCHERLPALGLAAARNESSGPILYPRKREDVRSGPPPARVCRSAIG
jgi:uncharacterized repeat protein (TIGR01451 family)